MNEVILLLQNGCDFVKSPKRGQKYALNRIKTVEYEKTGFVLIYLRTRSKTNDGTFFIAQHLVKFIELDDSYTYIYYLPQLSILIYTSSLKYTSQLSFFLMGTYLNNVSSFWTPP